MRKSIAPMRESKSKWSHYPAPGCLAPMSNTIVPNEWPTARKYAVQIADLYDDDVRDAITLTAFGEQDIRQQVREFHPGWYVRGWDEVTGG